MACYPPPGTYMVTTSAKLDPDQASRGLFSDEHSVVCVHAKVHGPLVTYVFMVDRTD